MSQLEKSWVDIVDKLGELYDSAFPIVPGRILVKAKEFANAIDDLPIVIPEEIKEAKIILQNKEEIIQTAKNKADRIIASAENERYRLLSESSIMKDIEEKAEEFKRSVIDECEDIKMKAFNEAEGLRLKATQEAIQIREGAQEYANQILSKLETDLSQLYQVVSNGKQYLNEMKVNADNQMSSASERR
ncbi:MAG: hypothetical protein E7Z91_00715 [Cyanobacteria bacterium SIG30]|nr:hypothetical protein [Cyanobacteria bacterium SIG30]